METPREPCQQPDHENVQNARDDERVSDAKFFRDGKKSGAAVEFDVLASVKDIEAPDPQRDRGTKNQPARVEGAAHGDPRGGGRHSEAKSKDEVRPRSETLGVRIQKKNGEGDGGKFERQA